MGVGSPVAALHEDPERRCGPRRLPARAQDVDAQQEAHGQKGQHQPPLQRHARYGAPHQLARCALRFACRNMEEAGEDAACPPLTGFVLIS